jgi:putative addiction module component (TIGR02574 family)
MSSATLEKLRQEADALTPDERLSLAEHLLATVPANPEIEKAWLEEAKRRSREAEAGKSGYVDWNDVKSKYENHLEKVKAAR